MFDSSGNYDITRFEWIWVDVYEQEPGEGFQDEPDVHPLYDGPHLYPLATVLLLIEEGVVNASPTTLPFGWAPLHTRPAHILRQSFETITQLWDGDKNQAKSMILSLIGIWTTQKRETFTCYRTDSPEIDAPGSVKARTFSNLGSEKSDWSSNWVTSEIVDTRSVLPLALQCKFHEALLMHKATRLIESLPRIVPLAARVDGIYYMAPDVASTELEALASRHKYPVSERGVFQLKDCKLSSMPVNPQAWQYCTVSIPANKPWLRNTDPDFESAVREINAWTPDDNEHQRAVRISAINGALITGAAGTGKSKGVLEPLRDQLIARGEIVHVCAYTHASARLVGGVTIARLLYFNQRLHNAWILVDEFSLIPIGTLGMLARLQLVGAQFVFFGDHEGQFEPMQDRWDTPYSKVAESSLLRDMCGGVHIKLTQYMRGTDLELFRRYTSMYDRCDAELPHLVRAAQAAYPVSADPHEFDLVLCVSHANRMLCNARLNEIKAQMAAATRKTFKLEWEGDDIKGTTCQPQTMIIWEGIELIGCPRGSGASPVVQGVIYTVKEMRETNVLLEMRPEYTRKDVRETTELQSALQSATADADETASPQVEIPVLDVPRVFRLTHSMCYFTVQGRSLDLGRKTLLLDTEHRHFTRRALIVGMSRVRHGNDLQVATAQYESRITGRPRQTFRCT